MRNWIHENELNEAMNCSMSIKNSILPGMGATMYVGSDRYAMVVVKVEGPKKIKVAYLNDEDYNRLVKKDEVDFLPDEYLEHYKEMNDYEPCSGHSHGLLHIYTLRKNGRWMRLGEDMWGTCSIHVGNADNYRDPNF